MSLKQEWVFDDKWLYYPAPDNKARYLLGTRGKRTLICFGVNPSKAAPKDLDPTLNRVDGFARDNGCDSWLMLNLYPQRATDPDDLNADRNPAYHAENVQVIKTVLAEVHGDLWAAWGDSLEKRAYLAGCVRDIADLAGNRPWLSLGLTQKDHPCHPLYVPGATPFVPFDMAGYVARL